jgi:hypothetical protein
LIVMDPKDTQKVAVQAAVSADQQKATVTAKPEPPPKPEPKTFAGKLDALDLRLGIGVAYRDGDELGKVYDEFDRLKPSNPAEETQHAAFARRLAHFAPRKLGGIKEIEATLDGETGPKSRSADRAEQKPEHPAVTKAKASLAELDARHQGNIPIPQDEEALAALNDKLAKVNPTD